MIVDDSLIVRTVLSRIIDEADGFEIAAKSSSAELAIADLADKTVDGNTTTWENIPGYIPQGSAGVFADLYLPGAPFGELDLSITTP